jgi:transcriptional regulator with PAS, ATPase and Fis domain
MKELTDEVELMARSAGATVLLLGESGTGKGRIAQQIHALSPRAKGPFVEINCAGLTATFLDSELFGHEQGAFTGAQAMKRGLFEVADRGTLFLDEVGDLAPDLQPKLLKVLESRRFRRLGGTREIESDVRLIAATNRNLAAEVRAGRFREDLYYWLNVLAVELPPVRERTTEDVLALVEQLHTDLYRHHPGGAARISRRALDLLLSYGWPGDVRQLRNVLERALVLSAGVEEILPAHLPAELRAAAAMPRPAGLQGPVSLQEMERQHIERTLLHFDVLVLIGDASVDAKRQALVLYASDFLGQARRHVRSLLPDPEPAPHPSAQPGAAAAAISRLHSSKPSSGSPTRRSSVAARPAGTPGAWVRWQASSPKRWACPSGRWS